jgi:hypothetical protein
MSIDDLVSAKLDYTKMVALCFHGLPGPERTRIRRLRGGKNIASI